MQKKKIAILRGGKKIHKESLASGNQVLLSLNKYLEEVEPVDIFIDQQGNWFEKGVPSDMHRALSKVDYFLDLTRDWHGEHHNLAEKINLQHVFPNTFISMNSRVNLRRILQQLTLGENLFSKYFLFRDKKNLDLDLKTAWWNLHMPVVLRPNNISGNEKSILTYSFAEAKKYIQKILEQGEEVLAEDYVEGQYLSLVLIPNYRGEDFYIPIALQILHNNLQERKVGEKKIKDKVLISHQHQKNIFFFHHSDNDLKNKLRELTKQIYQTLLLNRHLMIDFAILDNQKIKILEIHLDPHFFKDSRFNEIVSASGVDIGKVILDRMQKLEEMNLIY